jgi:uncharacterized protein (TIRG00374 family)
MTRLRRLNLILLAIALVFIFWLLNEVGWDTLGEYLRKVGWYWPLLLVPYGLTNLLDALSWKYMILGLPPEVSLNRLFWVRLGGEALNQLTPTASLGGEPFRVSRLQAAGVPLEAATASVVIHKGILVLSLILYISLGLALAPWFLPAALAQLKPLSLGALVLAAGGITFVALQRQNPCGSGIRVLDRLGWCPAIVKEKEAFLHELDTSLSSYYREYPRRAVLAFVLFFLSWVLHAAEVYVMFWLLGHPVSVGLAVCLDALTMLFTALGFFIPASAGVQEGGNILLALGFDLGVALGVAFSVLRRLREAFWMGLGLVAVWWEK